MRISKAIVTVFGALFAALGLGFWLAPERLAQRFDLQALGVAGLSTLRADMGGAFLTLAALCLAGAWLKRRALLLAAAAVLGLIVVGRLLAFAITGNAAAMGANMAVEVAAVFALVIHARALDRAQAAEAGPVRPVRTLVIAVAVIVAVGAGLSFAAHNPKVQDALLTKAARTQVARNNKALLGDDALRVAICGSSAPLPSPDRAKACVAVMAGGKVYIVDSGPESTKNLMRWSLPLDQVGGVLLTHFHSDHIGDLGELNLQSWVQGRAAPMPVYGGPGVEQVVAGFNTAYAQDEVYRTAHHTAQLLPSAAGTMIARPVIMPEGAGPRTAVVMDDGRMKITAIETNHAPVGPAYAYRFDYRGRSVVVTGDTTAWAPLVEASRGADVMVSEAMNREMVAILQKVTGESGRPRVSHIMHDIQSYHVSPTEAAAMANTAGVKLLVFYHLLPAPDNALLRAVFTRGVDDVRKGRWDLSRDGSLYSLPVGSPDVLIGKVAD